MKESPSNKTQSERDAADVDPDATSKETVSDLVKDDTNPESGGSSSEPGPSPDGALDESADLTGAGPM